MIQKLIQKEQKQNKSLNIYSINFIMILIAISAPWSGGPGHDLVKAYFSYCGISLLALVTLYYKTLNKDLKFSFNFLKLSLLLLFAFGTLSIFWSNNTDLTINKWLIWLTALLSFIVASNIFITTNHLIKLSWGLLIASGTIALIGILQHLFNPFELAQIAAPASTFANRNIAIQPLILIAPLFLFLLLSKNTQGNKVWLLSIITSFVFTYLFYTVSRGAWLSVSIEFILLLIYFIHYKFKKYTWIDWNLNKTIGAIFGLILIFFMCSLSSTGFVNIFDITNNEVVSLTGSIDNLSNDAVSENNVESWRYEIWKTARSMAYDSPLIGTGLGTFSHNLANEGYATWLINNTFRVHNDLLELMVEIGLTGVILFIFVIILILYNIIIILKNTAEEQNLFYFIIFVLLSGSFINLQFSFPYQMPFPILLFGLYCGLISKKFDDIKRPIIQITFPFSIISKKLSLIFLCISLIFIFHFTYFSWIKVYHEFSKDNLANDFRDIDIVETPIYHLRMQNELYRLGGRYFNKGGYKQSSAIDGQFLKHWPNHLDVLYRYAYSMHMLGQNDKALELSRKLKKLEPKGLYNAFIVEMFVYSSLGETSKLEDTFNGLLSKPEDFLKLNNDTYRLLLFFSLESKNLLQNTIDLYNKYVKYHGYHCEVTNNMAIYYFNLEEFNSSAEYVNLAYKKAEKNKPKCLNPQLIKLLKEKKLLNISSLNN